MGDRRDIFGTRSPRRPMPRIADKRVLLGLRGAPGRIRTCDLRIRSPLLYPAELRGLAGPLGPARSGRPDSTAPNFGSTTGSTALSYRRSYRSPQLARPQNDERRLKGGSCDAAVALWSGGPVGLKDLPNVVGGEARHLSRAERAQRGDQISHLVAGGHAGLARVRRMERSSGVGRVVSHGATRALPDGGGGIPA